MSRWLYPEDVDGAWAALFTGYQKSAYHLETKQVYRSEEEDADVAKFVAGEPFDPEILSWVLPKLRAQVAAGRTKTKIRVVTEPLTDYNRWALDFCAHLLPEGEDTRVIAVPEGEWPEGLPRHDFWLFDDHDLWRMHYHPDDTFLGAELIEDEAAIAQHVEWRDLALAKAVPLADYLAAHPVR